MLKQTKHKSGYLQTQLWQNQQFLSVLPHCLVTEAFYGPRPSSDHEAAHGNGISTDNRAENLSWKTRTENMKDRDLHGTTARGSRNGKTKFPDDVVAAVHTLRAQGLPYAHIALACGMSAAHAWQIGSGRQRKIA